MNRMDLLLDKVKGHHIEKVNELEEKIKGLQMYNENLRLGLVYERLNSRKNRLTTTTTDEDNNANEDNSPSDSGLYYDMEPPSFVSNVLVMDNVFGYLEVKELKKCRLICKDWNKAISSILSKLNNGNGLGVNLKLSAPDDDDDWDDLERTREIYSVLETAPENWFRTVNLDNDFWTRGAYKSVFQDFGNRLKVINVPSEDLYFPTLRSIFLDWCPNLEELAINGIKLKADRELHISRPLKLIRLSFNVDDYFGSITFGDVANILFTIIKNSPNLMKLESFGYDKVAEQIFSKLQNYPQIMNNLEEIFLRNASSHHYGLPHMSDPLEALSNIQFQSKLKKLVLTHIKTERSIALNRLLNKTNASLEKLTVNSVPYLHWPASIEQPKFQLNQMNFLQEFRYHGGRKGLINSIDILVKMPSLRVFEFEFEYVYLHDDIIDYGFSNCHQLMRNPHLNLNELHLWGYIQNSCDTFDVIDRCFPNLSKLVVGIRYTKKEEKYMEFSDLFKGMAKLKNLNKLFLDFRYYQDHENPSYKIGRVLSHFENFPNLIHLTMRGPELDLDEALFNKLPKLQRLTLIGVKMDLANAKKLGQLMQKRGIFLNIEEG